MLTRRQLEILIKLGEQPDKYQKAKDLAEQFHVSLRTFHQDLATIKKELKDEYVKIDSVSSKGYRLQIIDMKYYQSYIADLFDDYFNGYQFDDPISRAYYILMRLFTTKKSYITYNQFLDELFISKSTLSNDIKYVKTLLEKYHLSLVSHSTRGIRIEGYETNKRIMILKENISLGNQGLLKNKELSEEIRNIVSDVLNIHRYTISDVIFQSLILHVELALERMIAENYVDQEEVESVSETWEEYTISSEILTRLEKKYNIELKRPEVLYLSINLLGKKNYDEEDVISQELNDFIFKELAKIKEEYSIDFINDLDFRIALALHITPLLKRMKYKMQLKNSMTFAVKQNYPLAYDIATSITKGIYDTYGYKVTDDETAYLAIHINLRIEQNQKIAEPKRILIICPNRKSETLLLRQRFYQRFRNQIQELYITSTYNFTKVNPEEFDLIFTTEKHQDNDKLHAIHINYFLEEKDYARIELALNGIHDVSQLRNYFCEDLMFFGEAINKNQIIKLLCEKAEYKYSLKNLYKQVLQREELEGTYYGNQVAIPHPEQMIADDTFIALAVLKRPILWCGEDYARVIILVCIEKNNAKALQLWYFLSKLISDDNIVQKIANASDYKQVNDILMELNGLQ